VSHALSAFQTFAVVLTILVGSLLALLVGHSQKIAAQDRNGRAGPSRRRPTFHNHPPQAWAAP
jgi:hypothetical protein